MHSVHHAVCSNWSRCRTFDFISSPEPASDNKMPLVFLEQLPLPTLKSYVTVSVLLFLSAILYTLNVTVASGESDFSKIYEFITQDNFCFWVRICVFSAVPSFHIFMIVLEAKLWFSIYKLKLVFFRRT